MLEITEGTIKKKRQSRGTGDILQYYTENS